MLYFAYGSNMDWSQMRERCPSASFVCKARLPHFRLGFTYKSIHRKCGVADIVPAENDEVWGVIYRISDVDVGSLDKSEGYRPQRDVRKNSYYRTEVMVFTGMDEDNPYTVSAYFVTDAKKEENLRPNQEYKDLIVNGAKHWHLPADYIKELEKIKLEEDTKS